MKHTQQEEGDKVTERGRQDEMDHLRAEGKYETMKDSTFSARVWTGGATDDAKHSNGSCSEECNEDVRMDAVTEGGGEELGGGGKREKAYVEGMTRMEDGDGITGRRDVGIK